MTGIVQSDNAGIGLFYITNEASIVPVPYRITICDLKESYFGYFIEKKYILIGKTTVKLDTMKNHSKFTG
ncbi:MAG: hypothetical protein BGO33_12605 [Bacteroidia bacterium 43-41]|nr:MAG: hypothetical protein BGO33_12605 [Bacteroidia bacterium 43-41]